MVEWQVGRLCLAGVDGCRSGWVVALARQDEAASCQIEVRPCFRDVLTLVGPSAIVVIDIPIGLLHAPGAGGRACDVQARKLLCPPRASSVFSPPVRPQLGAKSWSRELHLPQQAFAILRKIREVDEVMTPDLQKGVYESHPELAFWALAGKPMQHSKKRVAGRRERLDALKSAAVDGTCTHLARIEEVIDAAKQRYSRTQVAVDDMIDACVMLWVAARIESGQARSLPETPPTDQRGLKMEMWL